MNHWSAMAEMSVNQLKTAVKRIPTALPVSKKMVR